MAAGAVAAGIAAGVATGTAVAGVVRSSAGTGLATGAGSGDGTITVAMRLWGTAGPFSDHESIVPSRRIVVVSSAEMSWSGPRPGAAVTSIR